MKAWLRFAVSAVLLTSVSNVVWAASFSSVDNGGWREREEYSPGLWRMKVWHTAVGSIPVSGDSVTIGHNVSSTNSEACGNLYLNSGGLDMTGNTLTLGDNSTWSSGSLYANVQFQGSTFTWSGGTYKGAFNNPATLILSGADTKTLRWYSTFHNYGTIRHSSAGTLAISGNPNNAYLYNWTNALYDIQTDGTNLITSDYGAFENYGTLRKSAGTGSSYIRSTFNSYGGTVDVQVGTLVLAADGTRTNGTLSVADGATLDLTGGASAYYRGRFSGTGAGVVQLASGKIDSSTGSVTFDFPNGFYWRGGRFLGVWNNPALIILEGTNTKYSTYYSTLNNYGTMRHTGGILALNANPNNGYFYNWTNGLYDIQFDGTNVTADYASMHNYGTVRKSAGTGTSVIKAPFYNYGGTVDVRVGTLVLAGDGTRSNGTLSVANGATLDLTGGQAAIYKGYFSGTGSGVVMLASGNIGQNSDATFNLPNGLYWRGGMIWAAFVHNQGLMILEGAETKTIRFYGQLHNSGTIRQTGSGALSINGNPNNAYLYNLTNAVYDIQSDGTNLTSDYGAFENYGTLRKSAGSGTSAVKSTFNNYGGTIEVRAGTLQFDSMTHTSGVLQLTGGILKSAGNYSQDGAGTLTIGVGGRTAGTDRGRLDVSGNATLGGTLNVTLMNGFIPALTDSFTIVSCSSRSGAFSSTNLPSIGVDRSWRVVYTDTGVYLQVQVVTTALPSDFDGDGKADPAVYLDGNWYIWMSSQGYAQAGPFPFGALGGIPVPADYDGDTKADPALVLGTDWTVWMSSAGYAEAGPFTFGQADWTPLAADFDGDRQADPARYGSTNGQWYIWMSSQGYGQAGPYTFGAAGFLPVAADFDGDGRADPAAYDPAGYWHIWMSGSGYAHAGPFLFGASGYTPATGDYDHDGKADPAVAANGIWYIWMSSQGYALSGPYQFVP